MSSEPREFDAPRNSPNDDCLDRMPLAREIASLATSGPEGWTIRIGVYGEWGAGKTTVLNFARGLVEKSGAIVVEFNPWGYRSSSAMLAGLGCALDAASDRAGDRAWFSRTVRRAGRWLRRAFVWLKSVLTFDPISKVAGAVLVGPAAAVLATTAGDLERVARNAGRRVVVFVDDVDRTDSRTLLDLLFLIKNVLDVPGFAFVLGLDPGVVGPALGSVHPGWTVGARFLEKLIDVPRTLPVPSKTSIAALVGADIRRFCPFVPAEIIDANAHLFPRNARRARAFTRHLWSYREDVARHYSHEVYWSLLIRIALVRSLYPRAIEILLNDYGLRESIVASPALLAAFGNDRARTDALDKRSAQIGQLCIDAGVPNDELGDAAKLFDALSSESGVWSGDDFLSHATMVSHPKLLSSKEYDDLRWATDPAEAVATLATRHPNLRSDLHRELITRCAKSYVRELSQAADEILVSDQEIALHRAKKSLSLLESLIFNEGGILDGSTVGASEFASTINALIRMVHFRRSAADREVRRLESKLFGRMLREHRIEPLELLSAFAPWEWPSDGDGPEFDPRDRLRAVARRRIETLAANKIIDRLATSEFTMNVSRNRDPAAEYILYSARSPLWQERALRTLLARRPIAPELTANVIGALLRFHRSKERAEGLKNALATDSRLAESLWEIATASRFNVRHYSWLSGLRNDIEAATGRTLPEPAWWAEVRSARA